MCGCGTFFCRKCSTSAVFCSRCNQQHQSLTTPDVSDSAAGHGSGFGGLRPALGAAGQAPAPGHAFGGHPLRIHARPLPQRLALEVALTLTVAVALMIAMFTLQERSYSFEPSPTISYGINAGKEPVQTSVPSFRETIWHEGVRAELTSDSTFTINARVQSTKAYSDEISAVMPFDFLLSWGELADEEISDSLTWTQADRRGSVTGILGGSSGPDLSTEYVISHVSNSHLIPADESIHAGLAQVQPGDMVRIKGRLVDVRAFVNEGQVLSVTTSKSRTDQGDGACEVIYVEELRVNGQTF